MKGKGENWPIMLLLCFVMLTNHFQSQKKKHLLQLLPPVVVAVVVTGRCAKYKLVHQLYLLFICNFLIILPIHLCISIFFGFLCFNCSLLLNCFAAIYILLI
jgi:hypothetical protein